MLQPFKNDIAARNTGRHLRCKMLAGKLVDKAILDIGCSFGWFEDYAVRSGAKCVVGIDSSIKGLFDAPKTVPGAKFSIGSALSLSFKDESFDLVTMFDVIEHIPKGSEKQSLAEIRRVLKKRGALALSTPYRDWRSTLLDPAWYLFGHRHYHPSQLCPMIENAGFSISEVYTAGGYWEIATVPLLYFFIEIEAFMQPTLYMLLSVSLQQVAKQDLTQQIHDTSSLFHHAILSL